LRKVANSQTSGQTNNDDYISSSAEVTIKTHTQKTKIAEIRVIC